MIVNEQRKVKLVNCCNAIYAENELINAALWYSDKPICSTKKIVLRRDYPSICIYDKKISIHRLLMMYWLQEEIPDGNCPSHQRKQVGCTKRESGPRPIYNTSTLS